MERMACSNVAVFLDLSNKRDECNALITDRNVRVKL